MPLSMPRHKLIVAYDGTAFHGWQKQQPPESEPLRTVQGVLEETISAVVREPVNVLGASRTDAGVHARGQVAAFNTSAQIPPERLAPAINSRLPDDVQVIDATIVSEAFDPIQDAQAKGYRYRLAHSTVSGGRVPLFDRHITAFTPYALDPARMNEAARRLIGEHDFASFTRLHHGRESTVRTVHDCQVNVINRHRLRIDVCGGGFLYNMVRIIAGTLLEVGRGRIEPEAIEEILAARDRSAAGPTMPPEGLCLMWVRYAPPEGPPAPPARPA
jgi:tRNA pseudouridine38-40 synthase